MTGVIQEIAPGEIQEIVTARDAKEIYNDPDNEEGFEYEIKSGRVSMGHSRSGARHGRTYSAGIDGTVNPYGQRLFAYNHSSETSKVFIEPAGFLINIYSGQMETGTDVESFSFAPADGGEALPEREENVLRRAEVLIQNQPGNTGNMLVGGAESQNHVVEPGASVGMAVGAVETIYVDPGAAGEEVNVTYEVR